MSPIQTLIQSFRDSLPPGTMIYVLAAELPNGQTVVQAGAAGGLAGQGPQVTLEPLPHTTPAKATPLARIAELRAELGADTPLKMRHWAEELGIPRKELTRAVKVGAMPHDTKLDGRDNKAHTVTVGVMENYLKTVSAVEAGLEEPPVWWKEVRGARAA
jgi:hypothetical protein